MCCVFNTDNTAERILGGVCQNHTILRWGDRGELTSQLTLMLYPKIV